MLTNKFTVVLINFIEMKADYGISSTFQENGL